jgi:signal transduction histidine kinase
MRGLGAILDGRAGAAPPRPSRPSRFDLGLALFATSLALFEGATRDPLPLRPLVTAVGVAIGAALVFRRTHPLPALLAGFGIAHVMTVAEVVLDLRDIGLHSSALVLLFPYALVRQGSAREIAIGFAAMFGAYVTSALMGQIEHVEEAIAGLAVLFFPAVLGASLRFRDLAHRREVEHAQIRERQMLARELHDTVAHHVAAIVIQAQAARAVAGRKPEAAADALLAIEGEAKRSLAELRSLVGALREDGPASLAPQARVDAIETLVRETERARFERTGDLEHLAPGVELALHRIAREALHNAARHAKNATRIDVRLAGEGSAVRLTVRDDGEAQAPDAGRHGFGLVGMKERAALLGGSLEAGPRPEGGWQVEAVLPRAGTPEGASA